MNNILFLPLLADVKPLTIILIAGGVLLIAAIVIVILLLTHKKGKKSKANLNGSIWLTALGEKENIKEVSAVGSRLNVILLDKEKIDREKLKELGVTSVLVMSNKVTLVVEGQAEQVASSIQKDL